LVHIDREKNLRIFYYFLPMFQSLILDKILLVVASVVANMQQIPGAMMTDISAGSRAVWGVDSNQAIYCGKYPFTSFAVIGGALAAVSAGKSEMWGFNGGNELYKR